jgi:O-antigen/teichoic acid export membrane protein
MTGPRADRVLARIESLLGDNFHLVRGSFGIMMSTILTSAAGWLFWAVATARWSPGQIGVSTSLIAALTTIALIAGQPISTTLLLRIPRAAYRGRLLSAGLLLTTAIALGASVIAILVLPESLRTVRTVGVAAMFTIGACAVAASMVLDAASLAIRKPQLMVARNIMHGGGKLLLLAAIAAPAGLVSGPVAIVGTWATLSVATCVWEWRRWSRAVHFDALATGSVVVPTDRTARRAGWNDLRRGFGLQVVGTLGGTLPTQVLPVVVITMLGSVRAGWFSITWQIGGLCFMISPAVCQALLAEGSLRPDQLAAKTRAAVALSSGLLVVPLLVYVFAGRFVLGLFGHSYAEHGTALLTILVISSIPDLITNVAVARYRVQGRLGASAFVNGLIAVVALSGAVWVMPHLGINGAGWAWAAGEVAGCLALLGIAAARGFRSVTPSGIEPAAGAGS